MSEINEFYLSIACVFILSALIFKWMMVAQKRKEDAADRKFQETLRMIELRNKTYKKKEDKK